eukprot:1423917-Rhodomonas_salina.2
MRKVQRILREKTNNEPGSDRAPKKRCEIAKQVDTDRTEWLSRQETDARPRISARSRCKWDRGAPKGASSRARTDLYRTR